MPTRYPELFAALAEPFPESEVKHRAGSRGSRLYYITARSAANRLDAVLGPENWRDEYSETREGLKCRLWIRLPDGEWTWKEDGGGPAGMQATDDNEKSAFSDAFKRACAKVGIARYLYRDGVPHYGAPAPPPAKPPARANGRPLGKPVAWGDWLSGAVGQWAEFEPIDSTEDRQEREWRLINDLVTRGITDGLLDPEKVAKTNREGKRVRSRSLSVEAARWLVETQPDWCRICLDDHLADLRSRAAAEAN